MADRRSFDDYMRTYEDDHRHPVNRLTHLVGIPLIVVSLPLLFARPRAGLPLFALGWALQFAGHYFEGKRPAVIGRADLRYLAIGPVWIAVEWIELLTGRRVYSPGDPV